jgi:hypothetical protein
MEVPTSHFDFQSKAFAADAAAHCALALPAAVGVAATRVMLGAPVI